MSEDGNVEAAATADGDTPVAPAQPAPQPTGVHLSQEDYATLTRKAQQAEGSQQYYQTGAEHGFKSPEDFAKWAPVFEAANTRGITPRMLAAEFSGDGYVDAGSTGDLPADLDAIVAERVTDKFSELDAQRRYRDAETAHESTLKGESKIVEAWVSNVLGPDASEESRNMVRLAALGHLNSERTNRFYDEGNPLSKIRHKPFDEESATSALSSLGELWQKFQGTQLDGVATAASAARNEPRSTAGSSGGQGKPQTKSDDKPPSLDELKERAKKMLEKKHRQHGSTMSSA